MKNTGTETGGLAFRTLCALSEVKPATRAEWVKQCRQQFKDRPAVLSFVDTAAELAERLAARRDMPGAK